MVFPTCTLTGQSKVLSMTRYDVGSPMSCNFLPRVLLPRQRKKDRP